MRIYRGYRLGYPAGSKGRLYLAKSRSSALAWGKYFVFYNRKRKVLPLYYVEATGIPVRKDIEEPVPSEIVLEDYRIIRIVRVKEVSINDTRKVRKPPVRVPSSLKGRKGTYLVKVTNPVRDGETRYFVVEKSKMHDIQVELIFEDEYEKLKDRFPVVEKRIPYCSSVPVNALV